MVAIVPAILSYSKADIDWKVHVVRGAVHAIHIDIMDGYFVKNKTVGLSEIKAVDYQQEIEYHLMVSDPMSWIEALPGGPNIIFQVHIESAHGRMAEISAAVARKHSKLCIAISPATPISDIMPFLPTCQHILVMTVVPGIDGQKYIQSVGQKITELRQIAPAITIEVDGGINSATVPLAVKAGANRLAAASAIFSSPNPQDACRNLQNLANSSNQ